MGATGEFPCVCCLDGSVEKSDPHGSRATIDYLNIWIAREKISGGTRERGLVFHG